MKKFPFLLLDAGPIIKLFELGIWDDFIGKCDVTISQEVANQAKLASREFEDIPIDLNPYKEAGLIKIFDTDLAEVTIFLGKFSSYLSQIDIHSGEQETLVFLINSAENWLICAADGAVFRFLGTIGKTEQGISLEEILEQIGLAKKLEWKYTKRFREKYSHMGQVDSIQGQGLA